MRTSLAFTAAALLAVLAAGCGDATSSAPLAPLAAGRFDGTLSGGLDGGTEGTAWSYDLLQLPKGPQIWIELRDERDPTRNVLVRFLVRTAAIQPGRYEVGGTVGEVNEAEAVTLQYQYGAPTADMLFVHFTGNLDIDEVDAGGFRGSFDINSPGGATGSLRVKGRFNVVPAPI
jgi:hypothetical protein